MQNTKTICKLANSAENDTKKKNKLEEGRVIIVQQT